MRLRTGHRLMLLVLLTSVASTFIVIVAHRGLGTLSDEVQSMYQDRLIPVRKIVGLKAQLMEARAILAAMINEPVEDKLKQAHARLKTVSADVDGVMTDLIQDPKQGEAAAKTLAALQETWQQFKATRDDKIIPFIFSGERDGAASLVVGVQAERFAKITEFVNALIESEEKQAAEGSRAATETAHRALLLLWSVSIVSVLAAALVALLVARSVTRALSGVVTVCKQLAAGDLTARLVTTSKDEFGEMAAGLSDALESFATAMRAIGDNAQVLASASQELTAVSSQMNASSEESSNQVTHVAAAAEQVSKNVNSVVAGVAEMDASIKEIARNATEAARVSRSAVQAAESTNVAVTRLGESSVEIGNVVKVITSIAEQTNLLALNATIEAARAGEAGKGFAVVANEVKELAKETARATEDVGRKIQTIQNDARDGVTAITQIGGIIKQVNEIAGSIAAAVEEQAATTSEMGRSMTEAAQGTTEIAQRINDVVRAAQVASAGAGGTQSAAGELARMATELRELVGRFKCGADAASVHAARAYGADPVPLRPFYEPGDLDPQSVVAERAA